MRFRVLGPVRVSPRTPTAAKPRAVLATLLIQNDKVVSTHTLIDELWGTEPPRTATTTLQVYVSQVRRVLLEGEPDGRQPLITRPPGYLLRVSPDDFDLAVFERLRDSGRAAFARRDYAEASRQLREALSLWTGPALSGIPHGPTLQTSAIRLEELRAEVLEQSISADLRLGRHQELVGELMALTREQPLRESLQGHLMVALYRSGRQSEALEVYRRARRSLVDELGVEPSPALRKLHERILTSDPALAWRPTADPTPRPAQPRDVPVVRLPAPLPDFTGRTTELGHAERFLAGTGPVDSRVLAVSGRPGAGKTAFAARLAHSSGDRFPDARVLLTLRDAGGRALAPEAVITALLRTLEAPHASGAPADVLHARTRGRKMLLILDDAVSEAQVRPVLAALPDATVILTSRHALGALEGVQHLVLDVLGRAEAEALLMNCGGAAMADDPEATAEIARLCGGLPLALRVAAAALAARPHWTAADLARRLADERGRLAALRVGDLDVRGSLLTAYRDVTEDNRHAFRVLGLAPLPDFALWSAAALLATDPAEAERRVEDLVQARLLEAVRRPDRLTPVRYGFHALLRGLALDVLAEESPHHTSPATARLAEAFLTLTRHADARLAPSRDLMPPPATAPPALAPEDIVGPSPLRWFREESPGLLETIRQTHRAGLWHLCTALASAAAGYYEAAALWSDWQESHELALDAARETEDLLAEAVVLRSLADLEWQRHHPNAARDLYRLAWQLFTRAGHRVGAGRCLSGEADVLLGLGRVARAERNYARALSVARTEADPRGEADAERGLALVAQREGRLPEAHSRLTACATAAARAGDERWHAYATRRAATVTESAGVTQPLEVRPGVWLFPES
ncbi:BTAD domain-containing putative transcriptional regulator [Streptomyces thermocoprophilus]|uniref:BTAD domain-containing putative transcriptional regulator n=1 Tax=Streptomyces thermocoprophilus TaxID=78356 RepID=A0ABV5V947_9ACTN